MLEIYIVDKIIVAEVHAKPLKVVQACMDYITGLDLVIVYVMGLV
jgi:hypothetical protein